MNTALANQMVMHSALRQKYIMPMNEAYQEMSQHTAIIFMSRTWSASLLLYSTKFTI